MQKWMYTYTSTPELTNIWPDYTCMAMHICKHSDINIKLHIYMHMYIHSCLQMHIDKQYMYIVTYTHYKRKYTYMHIYSFQKMYFFRLYMLYSINSMHVVYKK